MLRYVFLFVLFAIGLPLVMIMLGAGQDGAQQSTYDDRAFVEQEAPYSAAMENT